MGHRVKIVGDEATRQEAAAVGGREEALERAASELLTTLPQMMRALKHSTRQPEGGLRELGESQVWALYMLRAGNQLNSELARRFQVTNPTMSRIVDALVEKGFVERRPDVEDRRCINLHLTPEGEQVADQMLQQFHSVAVEFLSALTERQLADIVVAMGHIRSILPDGERESNCPIDRFVSGNGGAGLN